MSKQLKHQEENLSITKFQLFFMSSKNIRLKIRVRSIKEKLSEYTARSSMKEVCRQLVKADEQGLLKDHNVVVDMFATIAQNLHVQKNDKKYKRCSVKYC